MAFKDSFLSEFDQEMAKTRKTLERVPEEKFAWKPHSKSMAMGSLASHLVNLVGFGGMIFDSSSFDIAPQGGEPPRPRFSARTNKDLLETFDKNTGVARSKIENATEEQLAETWTLLSGGNVIFALPRRGVLRAMMLSHSIHHRAQLGVYLRLNDLPVPSIYGPSADEPI